MNRYAYISLAFWSAGGIQYLEEKIMPSALKSVVPWILFFVLFGHSVSSIELACVVALISHLLLNHRFIRKGFVFDIGSLVFFIFLGINVFTINYAPITNNGYFISTLAIALIAWVSLIIKRPFTLQYARLAVPLEISKTKTFLSVNYILTAFWAVLLSLMALPRIVEFYKPVHYATDINMGVSVALMVVGFSITKYLPEWLTKKILKKRFAISIKDLYAQHSSPQIDLTKFNEEKFTDDYDVSADVVIVGAGPVGLTAALLLQQHDIKVIVVEKHAGTSIHPKSRGVSCRSMELFRKLGIEDEIRKFNLPKPHAWFGWFSQLTGKVYARIVPSTDYLSISPTETGTIAQSYLEKVMLNKFQQRGGKVLFRHQAIDIAQNEDKAQLTIISRDTQEEIVFQAQYIIAADGTRSTLRDVMNIPMIGVKEINTNFSTFVEIDLDDILEEEKRANIAFIIRPEGPAPMVLSVDGKRQWIFIFPSAGLDAGTLKELYTEDYIKEKIYDVIGCDNLPVKIISKQIWTLGSQIANQFIAGRTFLAGDSIHQFTPTGAMGMNTGLQDIDNLIWKLAYVLQGKADASILQSYFVERLPSVLDNLQWSLDNLYRIVTIRRNIARQNLDKIDMQKLVQGQYSHINKSGLDLGGIYASDIIAKTKRKKPIVAADNYNPIIYPGARLPHFELFKENLVISSLDLVSSDFCLFCQEETKVYVDAIDFKSMCTQTIYLSNAGNIREVEKDEFKQLHGLDDYAGIWVRPDGHIAWIGRLNISKDVAELQRIICCMTNRDKF